MEPQYYILKPAVDTPETGRAYPAVESYPDYDFNGPRSVHKLRFRELPDFEPDIRFKLAKGANLTDMLSQATISAHGFLISKRLKLFFDQSNIMPATYYTVKVEDNNGIKHDYFWMHLVWKDDDHFIDWSSSTFVVKRFSVVEGEITLNSYSDYIEKSKSIGKLKIIKFTNLNIYPIPYQLFTIPIGTDIYTNEALAKKINYGLTGLHVELAQNILQIQI
jgi:hypothetical protein